MTPSPPVTSDQRDAWEASYRAGQNLLFYPNEEIVRFVSRRVRRRVAPDATEDRPGFRSPIRFLDLGCGAGRHVVFAHELGFEAHGIDLSGVAVRHARQWAVRVGVPDCERRIVEGDIGELPWQDGFFQVVVSHGVLDSMHFDRARAAIGEVARVLAPGGLCYVDLVSGASSQHDGDLAGEEIVTTEHERGTIQSYFDFPKLEALVDGRLELDECTLIRRDQVGTGGATGTVIARYHVILRKAD